MEASSDRKLVGSSEVASEIMHISGDGTTIIFVVSPKLIGSSVVDSEKDYFGVG